MTDAQECPICERGILRRRTNAQTGEWFLGCSAFPTCRFTVDSADSVQEAAERWRCTHGD